MKIKICGITNLEDASLCAMENVDFIGFNFYRKSERFLGFEKAKKIIEKLNGYEIRFVGIFVDEDISKIKRAVNYCSLNGVQLHGDEDASYIMALRTALSNDIMIIKAVSVKGKESFKNIEGYCADYFLFDSFDKSDYGGTGKTFDYSLLKNIKKEFFIAGGLSIINIKKAIATNPFGLDINSKVELYPGKKDHKKLREIIEVIRNETKY